MSEDNRNYWDEIEEKLRRIELERQREKEEFAAQREKRRNRRRSKPREEDFTKELLKMKEEEEKSLSLDPSVQSEKTSEPREPEEIPEASVAALPETEKPSLDDREMEETLAKLFNHDEGDEKPTLFGGRLLRKFKKDKKEPAGKEAAEKEPEENEADEPKAAAYVSIEPVAPVMEKPGEPVIKEAVKQRESTEEEERLRKAAEIEKRWTQKLDLSELEAADRQRSERLEVERYQLENSQRPKREKTTRKPVAEPPTIEEKQPETAPPEERLKRAEEIEKRWTQKLTLEDIQAADALSRAQMESTTTGRAEKNSLPLTEPHIRPKAKKEPVIPQTLPPKKERKEPPSEEKDGEQEEDLWMFKTPPEIKKETLTENLERDTAETADEKDGHLDLVWNVEGNKKASAEPETDLVWNLSPPEEKAEKLAEAEPEEPIQWNIPAAPELPDQPELPEQPQLAELPQAKQPDQPELAEPPQVEQPRAQADQSDAKADRPSEPPLQQSSPFPEKSKGRRAARSEAAKGAEKETSIGTLSIGAKGKKLPKIDRSLPFEKQMELRKQQFSVKRAIWGQRLAKWHAAFSKRERAFSGKVAIAVQRLDIRIEKFLLVTEILADRIENKFWDALDCAERNKMKLLAVFAGLMICAVGVTIFLGSITAYEYIYNGKVLGVVKDQDDVFTTIDVIGTKLGDAYETTIEIDKERDITFNMIRGLDLEIDGQEEILNKLTYMKDIKAIGYAIYVDGERVAVLQNKGVADSILSAITSRYLVSDSHIEYVGDPTFVEKVEVEELDILLGDIEREDEVLEYMLTGAVEKQIHTVEKGETFSQIASSYQLTQDELLAMNPGIQPEKLQIGQGITLTSDSPIVTVKTTEIATYTMPIEYETVYQDDSSMYKDEQKTIVSGVSGQEEVVAQVVRHNGEVVERNVLQTTTLSEPTSAVIAVGTKERPKTAGTGSFSYPIKNYRISSGYGSRWGRMHNGTDFAATTGTAIYAADGGTVTFAGYKGSFGYLVIINHGGGKETYYAHCSKLHVKTGQKVYKGQHIANVGNTGNSTGPHLHFEVRVNGSAKNPMNYLR